MKGFKEKAMERLMRNRHDLTPKEVVEELARIAEGKAKADELVFICRIKRDGSGVVDADEDGSIPHVKENNERFTLRTLSMSQGTYIASGFNSYVVKIKD